MARDGSGGYSPPASTWNPGIDLNSATTADWNDLLADLAAAIEDSVAADGQTPMTGNLPMGNNKITGMAAPTTLGDGVRLESMVGGADIASATTPTIPIEGNYFKITGTTTIAGFGATRAGRTVYVKFAGVLTLTHSTTFQMPNNVDVTTAAGDVALFAYDGTNWICVVYRSVNAPYTISYLAVGGGGGGGSWGGGGAGGMLQSLATVNSGVSYAITIGAGGTGSTTSPTNGADTVAAGIATATGGGRGGKSTGDGAAGGSGGGGYSSGVGGTGVIGQGFKGGNGSTNAAGGGGGAGAQGADATPNGAGAGGAGLTSSISGSVATYAGGGGGVGNGSPDYASGGVGGGGASGATGTAGTANTGGGGGASPTTPGNGGSGIFVLSYVGTPRGTGGTITQVGGNTIHTFTSSGTFTA